MTDSEKQIGRIKAVLSATEEVLERARVYGDQHTEMMAKETAYDHIKGIADSVDYCPWQE